MKTTQLARRSFCTTALAGSSLAISGCFGSFGLTKALWRFNDRLGGRFLSWLIFLLFFTFQVYFVVILIDVFVLNLLEFWTGVPVLGQAPPTRHMVDKNGNSVKMALQKDGSVRVTQDKDGQELALFVLHRRRNSVLLEDLRHSSSMSSQEKRNGDTELLDGQGRPVATMKGQEWAQVSTMIEQGVGIQAACQRGLAPQTLGQIARLRSQSPAMRA